MPWPADRTASAARLAACATLLVGALAGSGQAAADADPAAGSTVPALDERVALAAAQAAIGTMVPDYTLLDRQSRPVRLSSYRGKPLLVSFIYTGCFQVCPASTRALHDAVKGLDRLLSPNQFNVVSIGFNLPFDSPQALRAFATQNRIDYPNWEFLSPDAKVVAQLTRDFGFSHVATPAGFDHVLGVTVVDSQGRIHAQVYGDRLSANQLGEPLRQLLTNNPLPPQRSLTALIERVRILCTVYDPDTGEYRYNYGLIFEIVGGLGFFITVGWYLAADAFGRRRVRQAVPAEALPAGDLPR